MNSLFSSNYIEKQSLLNAMRLSIKYASGKLLDIGCGSKPYGSLFVNLREYIGIDVFLNKNSKNIDFYASGLHLPFKNETFDTVLSTQVLEHVSEPDELFKEANRVLKLGGNFILTVPQTWGLHEEPHDFFRYTKYGIKYLLHKNNFGILLIQERNGGFAVIGQTLCSIVVRRLRIKAINKIIFMLSNVWFTFLDKLIYDDKDTLGYLIIARRLK